MNERKKAFTGKKAFIFTIDSILAVLLSVFLAYTAFTMLDKAALAEDRITPIEKISGDSLAVMEETGMLSTAVHDERTDEVRTVLNALPQHVCAQVDVYANSTLLLSAAKTGCSCASAQDTATVYRSFIVANGTAQVNCHAVITGCGT